MAGFNDAYERFHHRHSYMGFYDFDEFLVVHASRLKPLLAARSKTAASASPLMSLLWSHGFPVALSFMNRWGVSSGG